MLKRQITRAVEKALSKMPDKQFCQVYDAFEALSNNPDPIDSALLKSRNEPRRRRKDVGEYRIIYYYDEQNLYIELVGKRNDDEIYKKTRRAGII